jgi:hypothetical protein
MGIVVKTILVDNAYYTLHNFNLVKEFGADLITSEKGGLKDASGVGGEKDPSGVGGEKDSSEVAGEKDPSGVGGGKDPSEVACEKDPSGVGGEKGKGRFSLADFETDDQGAVTKCPQGQAARSALSKRGDAYTAHFLRDVCMACPNKGRCPVKIGKRSACSMRYTLSSLEIARIRAWNRLPENVVKARMRNGVEGTFSEFKRVELGGKLRVRGPEMVDAVICLKMLGLNIWRFHAFMLERARAG